MNHSEPTYYRVKPAKLLVMVFLWFSCFSFLNTAVYTGVSFSPILPTTELVQTARVRATNPLGYFVNKKPLLVFSETISSNFFSGRKSKQITRLHDSLIKVKFSQLARLAHLPGKPTWFINQIRMPQPSTDDYFIAVRR